MEARTTTTSNTIMSLQNPHYLERIQCAVFLTQKASLQGTLFQWFLGPSRLPVTISVTDQT